MKAGRLALTAAAAAGGLGAFLYGPTFQNAFAYDDIDYLNQAADVLAGRAGFSTVLFRPQGEHFVPVLRLLLTASATLFGTDATPLRLLVFAAHVLSAVFLALAARRLLEDDAAAITAAVFYVLPCGFSSMWIWFPSGGCVPIGIAGVTGALAAVVHRDVLGRRRADLLAAAGCGFALLCDNSLVPLLAAPFLVSLVERRAAGDRRLACGLEGFLAALAAGALLLTRVFYARLTGLALATEPAAALKRFVFLAAAAPFRYVFPGPTVLRPLGGAEAFPRMEAVFGALVVLAAAAAFLLALTPSARRGMRAALATLPAGLGFLALVAVARWNVPYEELFDSDRYFFPLAISAALGGAVLVASLRARLAGDAPRRRALALLGLAAFAASLFLQRTAMLNRVSWAVYAEHGAVLARVERLAARLSDAARALPADAPPLRVPDAGLAFPEVHNGFLTTRFLLTVANRRPTPRLVLADGPVSSRDAALLDRVFVAWARDEGEAPRFAVEAGAIRDLRRPGTVDFLTSAGEPDVVSGFFGWERPGRWMSARGVLRTMLTGRTLRLTFDCPADALAAAGAPLPSLAAAVEGEGGTRVELGATTTAGSGWRTRTLAVPADAFERLRGAPVRVVLDAAPTWRPADVLRGSRDDRALSVRLLRLSFDPPDDAEAMLNPR